jgi:predicted nuclease with TOPRIM domain
MTAKLEEKSKEVEALQDELRTVTLQQEMQTEMVRKLRVEKSTFENEI